MEFVELYKKLLNEILIVFGKKPYPKFGHVVILAGGAGSGKGFQLANLIGIEGKVLDVDQLKLLAQKTMSFVNTVNRDYNIDISKMDLRIPENVSKLHQIINDYYSLPDKKLNTLFKTIAASHPDRKPNLIFDVTLSNITKLHNISNHIKNLGYKNENIHLVWVINDVNMAIEQNKKRERIVPEDILIDTHAGAALTMRKIIDMGSSIKKYLNGDIWFSFNYIRIDTSIDKSNFGGHYVDKATLVHVKKQGKDLLSFDELKLDILQKIKSYIPDIKTWKDK